MIRTNKVLFVGDLHLDSTTPSSRVDDYSDTSISKLYSLKNICLVKSIKCVVFLGDIFNKHDQSNTYLNKVLKVFKSFKDDNISLYTVVGNHDLSFERMDTLSRSPLQMLFTTGLLNHLDQEVLDTGSYLVTLKGLDYPDSPVSVSELDLHTKVNVLCAHRFFNYAYNDPHNLSTDDCISLGYQVYAMGHDHIQYDVENYRSFLVVRPGSFMRTSSHAYNLSRNVSVDIIEFQGTEDQPRLIPIRENLSVKPASEVFSTSVYQRSEEKSLELIMSELHERVGALLSQMDVRHEVKDIFKTLDSICTDPSVKQCIETYLAVGGYSRR